MNDRWAIRFTRGFLLVLSVATAVLILRFGSEEPVLDEWDFIDVELTAKSPKEIVDYVMQPHNGHRYIVARMLHYGAFHLCGERLKPIMLFSLGFAILGSWFFLEAARHLRGRAILGDMLIPALLLHWGHAFDWLMSYQLAFTSYLFFLGLAVWILTQSRGRACSVGLVIFLLGLCGGMGVMTLPPLLFWSMLKYWYEEKRFSLFLKKALSLLPAFVELGIILATTERSFTPNIDRIAVIGHFLAIGWGEGIVLLAPWGIHVASLLFLLSLGLLLVGMIRSQEISQRVALMGLAALTTSAFIAGYALSQARGCALVARYAHLSAPFWIVLWIALTRFPSRMASISGLCLMVFVVALNLGSGWDFALITRSYYRDLERDLRSGMTPRSLADRYNGVFFFDPRLTDRIAAYRDHHWRLFAYVGKEPLSREVQVVSADGTIPDPPPGKVHAVRIQFHLAESTQWLRLKLTWNSAQGERSSWIYPSLEQGVQERQFVVEDTPTQLRLEPECPSPKFTIEKITWLMEP